MDATMPDDLAASPLGRRLAFLIIALHGGGEPPSDAELAANYVLQPPEASLSQRRLALIHLVRAIGVFRVLAYQRVAPELGAADAEDARGRRWRLVAAIEKVPPYRLRFGTCFLAPPPGVRLRAALPEDAPALRAIERHCPITASAVQTWYDHGDDYFAGERLMGGVDSLVIEKGSAVVGVHSTVVHPIRIHGRTYASSYLHRTRILPDAQGAGLFSALNGTSFERNALRSDTAHSYVAEGNEASLRLVPFAPWQTMAERLIIDTGAAAGPQCGRPATPDDAERINDVLNRAHAAQELFVPYTGPTLRERLQREPAIYGWSNVLLADRAVVGVWDARLGVRREGDGGRRDSVRALVLDYGAEPGAEAELVGLLRAWCGRLAASGSGELALFTSTGDPTRAALLPLAARVDRYHVCIALREPADIGARGLYVDQLYF